MHRLALAQFSLPLSTRAVSTATPAVLSSCRLFRTPHVTSVPQTRFSRTAVAPVHSGSFGSGRVPRVQLPDDIIEQAFATSRIIAQLAVDGGKMSGSTAEGVSGATAAAGTGSGAPVIIDGKRTAETIHGELKSRIAALTAGGGRAPGLAVVLVGARTDSATYVRMKKKACSDVGIRDFGRDLPAEATTEEIVAVVRELNANPEVDGILVQLPLPGHVDENSVLDAISHEKDVDGIHPLNIGFLASKGRNPLAVACTPKGCIELLKRYGIPIEGQHAVVLGRSNIVGVPVSQLLLRENATVTVCHSRTKDIGSIVRGADIVVAAIGKANFVKGEWLKPGATVIDVGINSVPDASKKSGYRLVGDVDYESAVQPGRAGAITPVPGGVGPMTIAMLLSNTVEAYERSTKASAGAGGSK